MKKLFLLLAAGAFCITANAQENTSMMLSHGNRALSARHETAARLNSKLISLNRSNHAERTSTVTTFSDWFDYWNENYVSASAVAYYFNIYPDSTLLDPASSQNVFFHGLGMSFDPMDDYYYDVAALGGVGISDPQITATTNYTVDSFYVSGKYIRNNPSTTVVDSLIIDLVATSTTGNGTYQLRFHGQNYTSASIDTFGRFATAYYMQHDYPGVFTGEVWDSITVPQKQRYAIALDSAFAADTDANGDHDLQFALTSPLSVAGGQKVVSHVAFKSGATYALNTDVANANYWKTYAGDPSGGWPIQSVNNSVGSYQCGLASTNQDGYYGDPAAFTYQNHNILIPSVAYMSVAPDPVSTPPGFDVPLQAFHVVYDTGSTVKVVNVNNKVSQITAYPNPSNNQLNVTFACANASNVTISLVNMVGQVVATQNLNNVTNGTAVFNTAVLSAGTYVCTVVANGQRSTSRVVIAH